ncbi:MAG: histidine kinase [Xanthobacteraceae bacterium]
MPSLFRFLGVIGVIVGTIYAGMFVLAHFYDPAPREITVSIPPDRLSKQQR